MSFTGSDAQLREYLSAKQVEPLLKEVLADCLRERPANVLLHIRDFCKKRQAAQKPAPVKTTASKSGSQAEDDAAIEAKVKRSVDKRKTRMGVSADAFGAHNQEKKELKKVPKTDKERDEIRKTLISNFNFKNLSATNLEAVIDAMEVRRYDKGERVIKQGENGSELFIVFWGKLSCFKRFEGQPADTFLRFYQHGESFGELALMYNTPRAATVTADTEATLFVLDRATFNSIVRVAAIQYRNACHEVLSKIAILKDFEEEEMDRIIDCLENEKFERGEVVVKQGDWGEKMYFILEGTADVTKDLPGQGETLVTKLTKYNYFGEVALLKDGRREATVRVTSPELTAASIDKTSFKRLFGRVEADLEKQIKKYK